jgi:hypothetical protein
MPPVGWVSHAQMRRTRLIGFRLLAVLLALWGAFLALGVVIVITDIAGGQYSHKSHAVHAALVGFFTGAAVFLPILVLFSRWLWRNAAPAAV